MTLDGFIKLCGDEDILFDIIDDDTGEYVQIPNGTPLVSIWKSCYEIYNIPLNTKQRQVTAYYHTKRGDNLVMEIYTK